PHHQADVGEGGLAAGLRLVEIDHEGPGALAPGRRGEALELARLEVVGVRLELVADVVTLRLGRLGVCAVDAQHGADPRVDFPDHGIVDVAQVAGFAAPEV